MSGPEMSWDDQQVIAPPVISLPATSSNGSHTHVRLHRVEQKVRGMEYYVKGRGWAFRLAAWIGLTIAMIAGFAIQQYRIDHLHSQIDRPTTTTEVAP